MGSGWQECQMWQCPATPLRFCLPSLVSLLRGSWPLHRTDKLRPKVFLLCHSVERVLFRSAIGNHIIMDRRGWRIAVSVWRLKYKFVRVIGSRQLTGAGTSYQGERRLPCAIVTDSAGSHRLREKQGLGGEAWARCQAREAWVMGEWGPCKSWTGPAPN